MPRKKRHDGFILCGGLDVRMLPLRGISMHDGDAEGVTYGRESRKGRGRSTKTLTSNMHCLAIIYVKV
jgi:hypothetical protein